MIASFKSLVKNAPIRLLKKVQMRGARENPRAEAYKDVRRSERVARNKAGGLFQQPGSRRKSVSIAATLIVVLGVGAWLRAQEADPKLARFNSLSEKIVCQCGCNLILAYCAMLNCHSATPMRAIIKEEIAKGTSDEAILAMFVRQYGQVVISTPPATGFNLTAWVMPFLALGAGLVLVYFIALRMKRPATPSAAGAAVPGAPAAIDSRIEQELQNFEERQ